MNISVEIKRLRLHQKITQSELAREIDVGVTTVSQWETGRIEPNLQMILKLANFFDVTVDSMIRSAEYENTVQPKRGRPKPEECENCKKLKEKLSALLQ